MFYYSHIFYMYLYTQTSSSVYIFLCYKQVFTVQVSCANLPIFSLFIGHFRHTPPLAIFYPLRRYFYILPHFFTRTISVFSTDIPRHYSIIIFYSLHFLHTVSRDCVVTCIFYCQDRKSVV